MCCLWYCFVDLHLLQLTRTLKIITKLLKHQKTHGIGIYSSLNHRSIFFLLLITTLRCFDIWRPTSHLDHFQIRIDYRCTLRYMHRLSTLDVLATHLAINPCLSFIQQRGVIHVPHDSRAGTGNDSYKLVQQHDSRLLLQEEVVPCG